MNNNNKEKETDMANKGIDKKISFTTDYGEDVEFYVVEQTKLNGFNYLLVTEDNGDDKEADAYILKDLSKEEDEEAIYDMVEDDRELELIADIFAELLEDVDLVPGE